MTSKIGKRSGAVCLGLMLTVLAAQAGTFGRVVSIGGHASDLALDEARGVLYVANFTANRIEVMSLANGSVQTSMNVSGQPASLAISPDARHLIVGHYGNFAAPNSPTNAVTVIDLDTRGRRTFAMGKPVLGVAFGIDGLALVVTTTDFQLLDPVTGVAQVLDTVAGLAASTLPFPNGDNYPSNIIAASVAASGDGTVIYGLTDALTFRYDLLRRVLAVVSYTSTPDMGPRAIAVNRDGSYMVGGWVLSDHTGATIAQFPNPNGALHIGGHAFDSGRGLLYSQVPVGGTPLNEQTPELQMLDADNLRVRERLKLSENLSGKAVLSSDGSVMYGISDSGVTILPVGALHQAPRVAATQEDLIFRGNFCDTRVLTQDIGIINPGGGPADFTLSVSVPGVSVTPSSGIAPASVRVSVDPAAFQNLKGTLAVEIRISSSAGVNVPRPIRVLINNREPDQRGTIVNVPGRLVDLLADPTRDRFFILRQDTNEVLVYDGTAYNRTATLRTGNTPTQMAITFDRRYLLVGHENSQIIRVFDLETLEALPHVYMPFGHYPRAIAASGKAILAASRVAGPIHTIDRVDLVARRATELPSLGVYANDIDKTTFLAASPNGSSILVAQANGRLMLYNANADTFTVSRKDSETLAGAVAASSFDLFVAGNRLLNSSLVPIQTFDTGRGRSSGFAFVDQFGFRTVAPDAASPGVIERVDLSSGVASARATRMAEAPLLEAAGFTRTVAPLYSRNVIINLTTSGFTVLPWDYDASVAPPLITSVSNAADFTPGLATGGLITVMGKNLSPVNLASRELPLPTALGESCLTVNGVPTPVLFVSPTQINAQIPFTVEGNVTLILRTPGGVSDNFNLVVLPGAPGVFRIDVPGFATGVPTVIRHKNGELVTLSNPVHRGDILVIYLTGLGRTNPEIEAGAPAPVDPLATTLSTPVVTLGGVRLPLNYAGLAPGQVGVYQINAVVPGHVPLGINLPLQITQTGRSTTLGVRVVD